MKRILTAIAILGCVAMMGYADTNEVTSVNVVGYNKVNVPPGGDFNLISVQFDAFDQTLLGVFGTNQLQQGIVAPLADRVYIFNPGTGGYDTYFQKADGQFYDATTGSATNPPLLAGTGLWVKSPTAAGQTNEVVIAGEVVDAMTQSVDIVEGYQLLAYPYSTDIPLNDTDLANDGNPGAVPPLSDRLFLWTGAGYDTYWLKNNAGTPEWWEAGGTAATTNVIPMGVGFWYLPKAGGAFAWTEPIPYEDALK